MPYWLYVSNKVGNFSIQFKITNPLKVTPNSKIVCGKNNFCVNNENNDTNYYCYGNTTGCLWNTNDCKTDSDCDKYTSTSPRYTDAGMTCQYITPADQWPFDACNPKESS
jgi:hypothetical protein